MMNRACTRISILGGALLVIGGCGGSPSGGSGSGGLGGGGNNESTTVTFAITGATPTAVATKVGTGSFTTATPVSGKVTLTLPQGTTSFAVAFACPAVTLTAPQPFQQTNEFVYEASTLDGTSFSEMCPATPSTGSNDFTTGTLTGSVDASAIPGVSYLNINALNGAAETTLVFGSPSGNFSFAAPAGVDDLQVLAYGLVPNGPLQSTNLVAAKVLSGQTVPGAANGGNTVVLGAADQSVQAPITYSNLPAGFTAPTTIVTYVKGNGSVIRLASASASQYPLLPAAALTSGGYYSFTAYVGKSATNSFEEALIATTTSSPGPETFTFPAEWAYAGPVPAAWPSFDLSYAGFSGKTGVLAEVSTNWSPASNAQSLLVVAASQNFLSGSTTLAAPDLAALPGFLPAPPTGELVLWSAALIQANSPPLQALPSNGNYTSVSNSGSFTAP